MSDPHIRPDGRLFSPYDPECMCEGTGLDHTAHIAQQSAPCLLCNAVWYEPAEYTDADQDGWLDGVHVVKARYADVAGSLPLDAVSDIVLHRLSRGRGESGPRYVRDVGDDRHVSWHLTVHHEDFSRPLTQHVPLGRKAWHAGRKANACSLGIELDAHPSGNVNAPHDDGTIDTLVSLVESLQAMCPGLRIIRSHRSLAPRRRSDPGGTFPWERLEGLGLTLVP